jgi:hypothetical protein
LIYEACRWLGRHSAMNHIYDDALICTVQWILDNPKLTRENKRTKVQKFIRTDPKFKTRAHLRKRPKMEAH